MKRWLAQLCRFNRRPKSLGEKGELRAVEYLRAHGYTIAERNMTLGKDEADIVAIDPDGRTVVIVEVKTRRDDHVLPEEQVNPAKQHHLSRLGGRLLQLKRFRDRPLRFDVIAIVWPLDAEPTIRHHIAAFDATY